MTYNAIERVICQTTLVTVGIEVSPHLFRTAGASTAAVYAGDRPHLATALLHHTDPAITGEHYNRATGLSASLSFAKVIKGLRHDD